MAKPRISGGTLYETWVFAAFGNTSDADYHRFEINPATRRAIIRGLRAVAKAAVKAAKGNDNG